MALRFSQGMAQAYIGLHGTVGEASTDFALVDGGAGADTITRTVGDFTDTFRAGDKIRILGATDPSDDVETSIVSVAALTITLATGVFTTGQSSGSMIALVAPKGGTIPDVMNAGTLILYSGTRPTSANDDIGTATALVTVSNVQFGAVGWDSTNVKAYVEASISGIAAAAGTATWFRLVAPGDNATGSSTSAKRIDGTVGVNVGDIQLTANAFNEDDPVVFTIRMRIGLSNS